MRFLKALRLWLVVPAVLAFQPTRLGCPSTSSILTNDRVPTTTNGCQLQTSRQRRLSSLRARRKPKAGGESDAVDDLSQLLTLTLLTQLLPGADVKSVVRRQVKALCFWPWSRARFAGCDERLRSTQPRENLASTDTAFPVPLYLLLLLLLLLLSLLCCSAAAFGSRSPLCCTRTPKRSRTSSPRCRPR